MGPQPYPSADAGTTEGRATRDAIRDVWGPRTPHRVEAVARIPATEFEAAAEIIGTTPTLVSTRLQGVHQALQTTASSR
jgi:hypothetical protein